MAGIVHTARSGVKSHGKNGRVYADDVPEHPLHPHLILVVCRIVCIVLRTQDPRDIRVHHGQAGYAAGFLEHIRQKTVHVFHGVLQLQLFSVFQLFHHGNYVVRAREHIWKQDHETADCYKQVPDRPVPGHGVPFLSQFRFIQKTAAAAGAYAAPVSRSVSGNRQMLSVRIRQKHTVRPGVQLSPDCVPGLRYATDKNPLEHCSEGKQKPRYAALSVTPMARAYAFGLSIRFTHVSVQGIRRI